MAGGIKLFGDGPLGWRAGSLAAGTVVLLLLFALVRTAGGGPWLGVGVAGVASLDNLLMVHGRIAMLDVYALAFMLGAAILYLRERPLSAGLVLGVGACVKLASGYLLFAFGVMEALRWLHRRRGTTVSVAAAGARATALALCIAATGIGYAVTLQGLDLAVKPYDPGSGRTYSNALDHTRHMLDSATRIVSPGGPQGIASYPWTWLEGRGTIPYLTVQTEARTSGKVVRRETVVAFTGAVNPFVLFLVIPALALAIRRVWTDGETLDVLAVGWFAGMMVPFSLQAAFEDRTTYLYYIVVALPALYVAVVRLVQRLPPAAVIGWVLALMIGFADLYPFPQIM
ncbi:MAG: hypothetical protein JWM93_2154 [Frankiales bacterium]|nr:hypothetical protein [Frankiales bacterium]